MKHTRVGDQRQGLGEFDVGVRATIAPFGANPSEPQAKSMVFSLVNMTCVEKRRQSCNEKGLDEDIPVFNDGRK